MGVSPTNHDETKVVLGRTEMSGLEASCEAADPATYLAGLAVRRANDGGLALSSGIAIGVSLGISLSDTSKTTVARAGLRLSLIHI